MSLTLRVYTRANRLLCEIHVERSWRVVDVKEGIWNLTDITVIEQKLLLGDEELPDKDLIDEYFPLPAEEGKITLFRRPQEQSKWLLKCMEFGQQLRLAPPELRADRELVLAAVKRSWKALEFASPDLRADIEVAMAAVEQDSRAAQLVGDLLWSDRVFVLFAVQKEWSLLDLASPEVLEDYEIIHAAIKGHWKCLQLAQGSAWDYIELPRLAAEQGGWAVHDFAPEEKRGVLRADQQFVLSCVKHDWRCLYYVADELLSDRDIGIAAVKQDWRALKLLGPELQGDREIVELAVQQGMCCVSLAFEELPIDPELMREIVKRHWPVLAHISEDLRSDHQIGHAAVQQDWKSLEYLSESQRADPELVMAAAAQNPKAILMAAPALFGHKPVITLALKQDGLYLRLASDALKDDPEVVLTAVLQDWRSLQYASENVRSNPEVVFAAFIQDLSAMDWSTEALRSNAAAMHKFLCQDKRIMSYINPGLCENTEFVDLVANDDLLAHEALLELCKKNWRILSCLPEDFKTNRAIVQAAVEQDWHAIEIIEDLIDVWSDCNLVRAAVKQDYNLMLQATQSMWGYPEIVIEAVKQNWLILEEAPDFQLKRIWNDEEIVMECVKQDPKALLKAGKALWLDKAIIKTAVEKDWTLLNSCPNPKVAKDHWSDREIVLMAVSQSPLAFFKMDKDFYEDKEIVKAAALQDYTILDKCSRSVTEAAWQDRDIAMSAVKQNGIALKYATYFLNDDEVIFAAVSQNWEVMEWVPKYHQKLYWARPELVMMAIAHNVENLEKASEEVKDNKDLVLHAVTEKGSLLKIASSRLKADAEVVLAAVTQDGLALQFADESLKADIEIVTAAITSNGAALDLASEELQKDETLVELAGIT